MRQRHTPGPWYVGQSMSGADRPFGICRAIPSANAGLADEDGPGEETIAEVCPTSNPETARADAALIALAPELLAFVEQFIEADEGRLLHGPMMHADARALLSRVSK